MTPVHVLRSFKFSKLFNEFLELTEKNTPFSFIHYIVLKYTIKFIALRICHTSTFKSLQYAGYLSHELGLMGSAPTSLL